MELLRIEVDGDLRERIQHKDAAFPIDVWTDEFSRFVDGELNCHWHDEFEFCVVLSGEIEYYINETHFHLREGDCVFINSNALHMGKQSAGCGNAKKFTITFPASVFKGSMDTTIYHKYFAPVLRTDLQGFVVPRTHPAGRALVEDLTAVYALDAAEYGYELQCLALMMRAWRTVVSHIGEMGAAQLESKRNHLYEERAKEMLSYIHGNYAGNISVDDIAESAGIGRSECFRCFKRYTGKNPVAYLNEYRLAQAGRRLARTADSVTEVSAACGFMSPSYFGKLFKGAYGLSPLQYRRAAAGGRGDGQGDCAGAQLL